MQIIKTDNPDIEILTEGFTNFDSLTVAEKIDYIETENALYAMERQKIRDLRRISRVGIIGKLLNKVVKIV